VVLTRRFSDQLRWINERYGRFRQLTSNQRTRTIKTPVKHRDGINLCMAHPLPRLFALTALSLVEKIHAPVESGQEPTREGFLEGGYDLFPDAGLGRSHQGRV